MNIRDKTDTLQSEIDQKRQEIRSDNYSTSIGEWISLYQQGEIEIHPEFQRFFRWSDYQKTKLIESILLGIPIPPIFVSQREDGIWDVVDGLQRLSTIYQFVGILKDEEGKLIPPLTLQKTEYLPSLEGKVWEDKEHPDGSSKGFTPTQRLLIKRAKIDVNILLKESDPFAKYELFQRLNTGGSIATPQELRNCILVSLNPDFYRWIKKLSENENFQACIALNDKSLEEQYDIEILCRFLVLRNIDENLLNKIPDVDSFFTEQIQEIANNPNFDKELEQAAFEKTFQVLSECMGSDSFKKYDVNKQKFYGGFMLAPFETIALGIGYNYLQYHLSVGELRNKIIEIWSNPDFTSAFGRGKDARARLPKLIPLGRRLFSV
ncbi:DUF262 domain-containing protein [Calothrix sp. NIES-3974]|uniref:DUF262 domain-containing protein n=1 Tax=Calothrix sp. NIES-3974 TaxID=2005462 RepID=UPI000B5DD1B8|nr:DUF262 domain-containing protein [Calothrix sp. NIES-3974]BAZ08096.1 hypothetical protein NIES3974_47650 [Calothrix sp. NIES-3974]